MVDIARHERIAKAMRLVRLGFRAQIVILHTGIPASSARAIVKQLRDCIPISPGPLKTLKTILSSRRSIIEASIIGITYLKIAGEQTTYRSVDIEAVIRAHRVYLKVRGALPRPLAFPIDINEAWVIAREFRSGHATLHHCSSCSHQYLVGENGETQCISCPICHPTASQH